MSIVAALRTRAAIALAATLIAVGVSLPEELVGQDAAGSAMLSGIVGLPALAVAATLAVQVWRGAVAERGSLDRLTLWLCRAPAAVLGLMIVGVIVAIVADR